MYIFVFKLCQVGPYNPYMILGLPLHWSAFAGMRSQDKRWSTTFLGVFSPAQPKPPSSEGTPASEAQRVTVCFTRVKVSQLMYKHNHITLLMAKLQLFQTELSWAM